MEHTGTNDIECLDKVGDGGSLTLVLVLDVEKATTCRTACDDDDEDDDEDDDNGDDNDDDDEEEAINTDTTATATAARGILVFCLLDGTVMMVVVRCNIILIIIFYFSIFLFFDYFHIIKYIIIIHVMLGRDGIHDEFWCHERERMTYVEKDLHACLCKLFHSRLFQIYLVYFTSLIG